MSADGPSALLAMRGGISIGALLLNGVLALAIQAGIAWTWLRGPAPLAA